MSYQPRRMSNDDNPYKRRNNYESENKEYRRESVHTTTKSGVNKPKSNKKVNKVMMAFKILALIFLITTIVFYISVNRLNLLPTSYFVAFTLAEVILTSLIMIGLAKKHKTYKLNV